MVLTTHATVGAALAELMPEHAVLAFCVGFISHFLLDAIPHWDYKLLSVSSDEKRSATSARVSINRHFVRDALCVAGDAVLGFCLAMVLCGILLHAGLSLALFAGALAAVTPDFLSFVFMRFPDGPLRFLQRFHGWIHARTRIDDWRIGVPAQILVIGLMYILARTLLIPGHFF